MLSDKTSSVADMLAEIRTETASQLLSSVLYQTSPPGSTGIPSLDEHLINNAPDHASPSAPLNRGDVLEIQGPASSGKTQLVYYLTMQCILPHEARISLNGSSKEIEIGGWGKSAVVMDTDGKWSAQRLKLLLIKHVEQVIPAGYTEAQLSVEELVNQSMHRLHVFRPKSSVALAATLLRLPLYHAEYMHAQEVGLIVIDSISSFYWMDRYTLEQRRHGSTMSKDGASPLSRVLVALQEIRLSYGPVTVFTNWGLSPLVVKAPTAGAISASQSNDPANTSSPFYRQHLHPFPAPFEIPLRIVPNAHLMPPITHHITLALPDIDQAYTGVSDLEAGMLTLVERSADMKMRERRGILRIVKTGNTAIFTFGNHK